MTSPNLIIAGGGLAGSIAALALAERRPDVAFVLIEQDQSFGGNHIWSFFDGDVDAAERGLIDPLVTRRWPDHQVHFPTRRRILGFGYNSVRSADLDRVVRDRLRPDQYRLGQPVSEVGPGHVTLASGERIAAGAVIDARGPGPMPGLDLGWQKFVGRTYRFDRPHGRTRPTIMDATIVQEDGYRFLYALPFDDTELLLEDTFYSASPALDTKRLRGGLDAIADGIGTWTMVGEESGLLPVLLDGELDALWPSDSAPVGRLGLRGGFFHPTTGYSLPDAVSNAALLRAPPVPGPLVRQAPPAACDAREAAVRR